MMSEAPHDDLPLPGDGLDLPDLGSEFDTLPVPQPAPPAPSGARPSLAPLADVPVTVEAVLGGCTLTVDELLGLGAGSVIEVDRRVGDPIDLMVGGRLLARGELVLIDGALGLTLTELVRREDM